MTRAEHLREAERNLRLSEAELASTQPAQTYALRAIAHAAIAQTMPAPGRPRKDPQK